MASPRWTSKQERNEHYNKHVASSGSCWSDLLNKPSVSPADYNNTACAIVNAPRYQYRARMMGENGSFYGVSLYSVGDQLVQSITDLTKTRLFTCYHIHKTSSHCDVMNRPAGEQIEELKHWIDNGTAMGKIRDMKQLV